MNPITRESKRDLEGNIILSKLNEQELIDISHETSWYIPATERRGNRCWKLISQYAGMEQKTIQDNSLLNFRSFSNGSCTGLDRFYRRAISVGQKESEIMKQILLLITMVVIACFCQAQAANSLINKGNEAYRLQQYDKAAEAYREALQADPNNTTAAFNLGNALF